METSQKPARTPEEQRALDERMAKVRAAKAARRAQQQQQISQRQTEVPQSETETRTVAPVERYPQIQPSGSISIDPDMAPVSSVPVHQNSVPQQNRPYDIDIGHTAVLQPSHQAQQPPSQTQTHNSETLSLAERAARNVQFNPAVQERVYSSSDTSHILDTSSKLGRPVRGLKKLAKSDVDSAPAPSENSIGNYASLVLRGVALAFALWLAYNQLTGPSDVDSSSTDPQSTPSDPSSGSTSTTETFGDGRADGEREQVPEDVGGALPATIGGSGGGRGGFVNIHGLSNKQPTFLARNGGW